MFRVTIVALKGRVADKKIALKRAILRPFRRERISRIKKPHPSASLRAGFLAKYARNGAPEPGGLREPYF
jgi:hypothetical protein